MDTIILQKGMITIVTYNDKILVPNGNRDNLDTIHLETNTGNVYDFKNKGWLDDTFENHTSNEELHVTQEKQNKWNLSLFSDGGLLTGIIDFNNSIKENTIYQIGDTSGSNYPPPENYGVLIYFKPVNTDYGYQQFTTMSTGNVYIRTTANAIWQNWTRIISQDSLILPPSVDAVLQVGWSTTEDRKLRYYKDAFGIVHLSGRITTASANNSIVTILPIGYRPLMTNSAIFIGASDNEVNYASLLTSGEIYINPNGKPLNVDINTSFRTT